MPVFRHAVASFEPRATSVLLWTRLSGGATSTGWVLARDPTLTDVVAEGEVATGPDLDHTVTVDVDGLEAGTAYWYRFDAGGESSPVGRTRTLPAGDGPLRLGLVACARFSVAPLGVYRALAEREVDLVLHLGDYIYEDDGEKGVRSHEPPRACVSLADYRTRLAQHRRDPDCQALHLRHPMSLLIDDHDVADNCWTTGAKAHDPDTQGPFADRALAASRARQEWVPSRLRDPADPTRTWRSFPVGDLAEVVLLDTRLSGRHRQAGDERDDVPGLDDPDRSLLGDDQRAWLAERLADTTRPWAIVATGVVVNDVTLPLPAAAGLIEPLLPNGYAALDGKILHDDQWDGYPAERERLVQGLQRRARAGDGTARTLVLSGDIHSSWAFVGPHDPVTGEPAAVEATFPAVASKPMGRSRVPGAWRLLDASLRRLEHVPWVDVTERGYGIVDLTPDTATVSWWFLQATASDPAAEAWPAAAFRTGRSGWPPRLERVPAEDLPTDPVRPGLPDPLPPRPADLARMRRSHLVRTAAARGVGTLVPALLVAAVRRTRRRR
ncbi:MAG TPA: alkaline phosphatase D family protein [Acidimicrobiales bacterium]|nr:alkaline phosphatase D family protein [Acidimicrobiales bacterium]